MRPNGICTESVLENKKNKILWDFEIPIDYLGLFRRSDLLLINKKKQLAIPVDHWVEIKESEKIDKYLTLPAN